MQIFFVRKIENYYLVQLLHLFILHFFSASTAFLAESQPPKRKALAMYPLFLFYFVISWLIISHTHSWFITSDFINYNYFIDVFVMIEKTCIACLHADSLERVTFLWMLISLGLFYLLEILIYSLKNLNKCFLGYYLRWIYICVVSLSRNPRAGLLWIRQFHILWMSFICMNNFSKTWQ